MRKITFRASEAALDRAQDVACSEGKTLEGAFQEWLVSYGSRSPEHYPRATKEEIEALFRSLKHVKAGRKFTRDEMNEC